MYNNYSFTALNKPLKYPVRDENFKIMIPAGATGVEIAYSQSSKTYKDKMTGKIKHQNVYRWHGEIYNM